MLSGFRLLQGIVGSAVVILGGGIISVQEERGKVVAIWSMCPLLGSIVGPVMGEFLSDPLAWRWVFWILAVAVSASLRRSTYRFLTSIYGRENIHYGHLAT